MRETEANQNKKSFDTSISFTDGINSAKKTLARDKVTDNETNPTIPKAIYFSFACGGWLKYYLFGVGKAIREHDLHHAPNRFIGSSAGALTALGLTIGNEEAFDHAVQYSRDYCMPEVYDSPSGPFKITKYVSNCLND